ncbi:MAG: hypothetical protein IT184_13445 [Acidobacteria bacterium]|nr:hypothetical protein [Acidobacteriota bacterium]
MFALAVLIGPATAGCGESDADRAAADAARAKAAAEDAAKAKARAEAAAAMEAERLEDLWTYTDTRVGRARQLAAQIRSTNDVDADGQGGRSVLLVFRDHADWGRSSYLVLTAGDFNCSPACAVSVAANGAPATSMKAHRPTTDQAIALFIDDWRVLWRTVTHAKQLSVEFPVRAGGTRTATFDVGGLDPARMPAWPAASAAPR